MMIGKRICSVATESRHEMTEFYLIRHGQTTGNTQGIKQGTTNTAITHLNETGQQQAQRLHDHFAIDFADQLFVSPLIRTQQTAAIVTQTAALPQTVDQRLLEISYGRWDGQLNAELKQQYPALFSDLTGDVLPAYAAEAGGETFADVERRVADFVAEKVRDYPTGKLVVVTHGFTVRSFVVNALQVPHPLAVPEPDNTSVTKIRVTAKGQQVLEYFNRIY